MKIHAIISQMHSENMSGQATCLSRRFIIFCLSALYTCACTNSNLKPSGFFFNGIILGATEVLAGSCSFSEDFAKKYLLKKRISDQILRSIHHARRAASRDMPHPCSPYSDQVLELLCSVSQMNSKLPGSRID